MTSGVEDNTPSGVDTSMKTDSSSKQKVTEENGDGDAPLVDLENFQPAKERDQDEKKKPVTEVVRPKQFGLLKDDERKLIKCCEEGKTDEVRVLLRNKRLKVDCLDDVSLKSTAKNAQQFFKPKNLQWSMAGCDVGDA